MSERILMDTAKANPNFSVSLLSYFNPVGAHESGLIGEDPNGIPNNLMPFVTKVAKGVLPELSIFGDDYDTVDGTGVRDYIHVVDLAKGHVKFIEKLDEEVKIYNLGTGKGTSVLELVNAFIKVNKVDVPYKSVGRRTGDIATCFANASKAEKELSWKAELTIEDMARDAWRFEALAVREYLENVPEVDSLIIVTAKYHSGRAKKIFDKAMKSLDREIKIISCPTKYDDFNADRWWKDQEDLKRGVLEYLKLLNFYTREQFGM